MNDRKWAFMAFVVAAALFVGVSCFSASAPSFLPNEYNYETMAEFT